MRRLKVLLPAIAAALSLLAFAACGGDENESAGGGGGAAGTTGMTDTMGEMEMGAASGGEVSVESPAADLRVTLDRLLGEHAILAMLATQKGFSGDQDFKAISAALDGNSQELAAAIGSVYGEEAGRQFLNGKALWRDHIKFFVNYTVGLAEKDKAAQAKAVNDLNGYIQAFPAFLAEATDLPVDALRESITEHVTQLKGQIDAYAAGDYERAYTLAREAYAHMVMTGDTLAGAIVEQNPDEYSPEGATASAVDLRVRLDTLLGEHALLAMFATQKGFAGDEDFDAISAALDGNSRDLADAIGSVYGDKAGRQFLNGKALWRDHIGFFVDYTVGLARNDSAAQEKAVNDLNGYIQAFPAFLAEATDLPDDALRESITEHVTQLKTQIDRYAAGEYAKAYETAGAAYEHMFMTGDTLAGGIVAQSPDKFGR